MSTRPPKPVRDALDLIRPTAMLLSIANGETEQPSRRHDLQLGLRIGILVNLDDDLARAALTEQLTRDLHAEGVSPDDAIDAVDIARAGRDQSKTRVALLEAIEAALIDRVVSGSPPRAVPCDDARGARFGGAAEPAPHATTADPDSGDPAHASHGRADSGKSNQPLKSS